MLTFQELARIPTIAELKADAASIAQNERWPWYEPWIPRSRIFARAIDTAAAELALPRDEVRDVALTGLIDVYEAARRRRKTRKAT